VSQDSLVTRIRQQATSTTASMLAAALAKLDEYWS